MIFRFFISFIFLFLFSCATKSNEDNFRDIKNLEFSRNSDIESWKKLNDPVNLPLLIESIGKTALPELFPFLSECLDSSTHDTILCKIAFAMGQMQTANSTEALLNFPLRDYDLKVQKCFIDALALHPTEDVYRYFHRLYTEPDLKPALYTATAILIKNGFYSFSSENLPSDSSYLTQPSAELAYLLSYSGRLINMGDIITMLSNSSGNTQKYLLKAIINLNNNFKNQFTITLKTDSTAESLLNATLKNILKSNADWPNKYYALKLAPLVVDSLLTTQIEKLVTSPNAHIQIEALRSLAESGAETVLSLLLSAFENEDQWYIKGELIKSLSEFFPNKAYPFIMQNLDRGDANFKSQLLEALALLNTKLAVRTLRQFLNIDDPLLVNTAFGQLESRNLLRTQDIEHLLNSNHFSVVATVLDYYNRTKKEVEIAKLKLLYKKFKYPSEFEVQFEVVDALQFHQLNPADSLFTFWFDHACHKVVTDRLQSTFKDLNLVPVKPLLSDALLPSHLNPDSIQYYPENLHFEIVTSKGIIKIELFSQKAPLTVFSFKRLVDMNYYNNLIFHRVVPDFVIQGGDPLGDGWGGPNFLIPSEHISIPFKRGSIGIATSGFDTGGSQFFICQSDQPHLNGKYTLFGRVTEGLDIVDSILPGDKIIKINQKY